MNTQRNKQTKREPKGSGIKSGKPQRSSAHKPTKGHQPKSTNRSQNVSRFPSSRSISSPHSSPPPLRTGKLRPVPKFNPSTEDVPAAIGSLGSRRSMSLHGDMFHGIRMSVCQPLVTLGDATNAATALSPQPGLVAGCILASGGAITSTPINMLTLSPFSGYTVRNASVTATPDLHQDMVVWDSPIVQMIGGAFSEYCVEKLTVHFEPQGISSQSRGYAFGYSMDPLNSLSGIGGYFSNLDDQILGPTSKTSIPAPNNLDASTSYIQFQPWMSWSMDLPVDNSWKYVRCPGVWDPLVLGNAAYNSALVRQTQFGVITLLNLTGNGQGGAYGRLWIDAEIVFRDPTPLGNSFILPSLFFEKKDEDKKETKEEEKGTLSLENDDGWSPGHLSISSTPLNSGYRNLTNGASISSTDSNERKKIPSKK